MLADGVDNEVVTGEGGEEVVIEDALTIDDDCSAMVWDNTTGRAERGSDAQSTFRSASSPWCSGGREGSGQ